MKTVNGSQKSLRAGALFFSVLLASCVSGQKKPEAPEGLIGSPQTAVIKENPLYRCAFQELEGDYDAVKVRCNSAGKDIPTMETLAPIRYTITSKKEGGTTQVDFRVGDSYVRDFPKFTAPFNAKDSNPTVIACDSVTKPVPTYRVLSGLPLQPGLRMVTSFTKKGQKFSGVVYLYEGSKITYCVSDFVPRRK